MKKLLLFGFLLTIIGCKQNNSANTEEKPADKISSDTLIYKSSRKVDLLPETKDKVGTWLAFAAAQNQIETMKTASGADLVNNAEPLIQIMEALQNTLPDSLRAPAVKARLNVLLTKAHVLHQLATKKERKSAEIFETAEEIIWEFDNFKIQLNEFFIKKPEDFEMELDRVFENEEEDSLILPESRQQL